MLTTLQIRDLAVVAALDLDLQAGLTVLTGETGAGKSILLTALGLALGDRGCLALASRLSAPVLTADQAWVGLKLDVEVRSIRGSR